MTVSIRQLHPHFFGEVSGVDLRKPLTPQQGDGGSGKTARAICWAAGNGFWAGRMAGAHSRTAATTYGRMGDS